MWVDGHFGPSPSLGLKLCPRRHWPRCPFRPSDREAWYKQVEKWQLGLQQGVLQVWGKMEERVPIS